MSEVTGRLHFARELNPPWRLRLIPALPSGRDRRRSAWRRFRNLGAAMAFVKRKGIKLEET